MGLLRCAQVVDLCCCCNDLLEVSVPFWWSCTRLVFYWLSSLPVRFYKSSDDQVKNFWFTITEAGHFSAWDELFVFRAVLFACRKVTKEDRGDMAVDYESYKVNS